MVVQTARLLEISKSLKAQGKKTVFTNGCFDILHLGHVRYLQEAKALGDVLVVGINSDSSVTALKGELRPLVGESARSETLAALVCVDYVVIFPEPTAEAVISWLQPDIYVKGGDYGSEENIPESRLVRSYGGTVQVLPFVPGFSTSDLIDTIIQRYHTSKRS